MPNSLEEENTESDRNCAEKAQIDTLGKSPILWAITWPTISAPINVTITIICYNNIEKNNL